MSIRTSILFILLPTLGMSSCKVSEVKLPLSALMQEKQDRIRQSLDLNEQESKAFWPVYSQFEEEVEKSYVARQDLIRHYFQNSATVSGEEGIEIMNKLYDIHLKEVELRKAFVPKFGNALPPRKTARFLQLENQLDVIMRSKLGEQIPLYQ